MANTEEQGQGCLTAILNLFKIGKAKEKVVQTLPYKVRDDFLSPAEISFYHVLMQVVQNKAVVCPKVRLADIFFVSNPNRNLHYFNQISAKHIDFLLCQPGNMKPIVGIELDDASHERLDRYERDEFVKRVFKAAKLPLVRVPVRRGYQVSELAQFLNHYFDVPPEKAPAEVQSNPPSADTGDAPECPKCGIPMLLRTVGQGEHKGKQFYGCRNFPNCREMKPYNPPAG